MLDMQVALRKCQALLRQGRRCCDSAVSKLLQVGPPDKVGRQQILAMTGSTPHLCNEIGASPYQGFW